MPPTYLPTFRGTISRTIDHIHDISSTLGCLTLLNQWCQHRGQNGYPPTLLRSVKVFTVIASPRGEDTWGITTLMFTIRFFLRRRWVSIYHTCSHAGVQSSPRVMSFFTAAFKRPFLVDFAYYSPCWQYRRRKDMTAWITGWCFVVDFGRHEVIQLMGCTLCIYIYLYYKYVHIYIDDCKL